MGIVKGAFSTTLALDNSQADRYYPDSRMTLYNKSIKIKKKRGKQFMELKHVIPNMEKTFGNLEFAGENKVEQRRINGRMTVVSRSFNLYSDVQRADDIIVVLPASAGEKNFESEEKVKLINPKITAEGYKIGTRGFTNYILSADDMVKAEGGRNIMRLANGIIIDKEKTFGVLKFSALRREVHIQNEDGTVSEEIKERTYDLKCKEQGRMIQVSIPASVPLKEFDYNTEVEIINPVADTVATATFQGADVDWYIKADDIVLKNKNGQPAGNNHAPNNPQQPQHKK